MQRRRFLLGLSAAGAFASFAGRTAFASADAGASSRPIRVRLFSRLDLRSADIAGVRVDASSSPTVITPQSAPIDVSAILSDGTVIERHYAGLILAASTDGKLALYNDVDVESYVASVMSAEISSSWHAEALKAQAIAIRTYGLRRMRHSHPATYDVTDDTTNQVYHGVDAIVAALRTATDATTGTIVSAAGAPADVWYHSACGGHTASSTEITGVAAPAYLQGCADADGSGRAYCAASPYYAWRNALPASALAHVAGVDALASIVVSQRWPDGRVRAVHVEAVGGAAQDIDGHRFYATAIDVLGYKVVPSALFDIDGGGDSYVISGHGVGHGVGMCQWGAQGRARAGQTADDILAAYFPGTTVSDAFDVLGAGPAAGECL